MNYTILEEFEKELSVYTGAPFVVLTDCCTHAIELCLRYKKHTKSPVILPKHTYVSILMLMHKLENTVHFDEELTWAYGYRIAPTNVWDCARAFDKDMYVPGRMQCLSFGHDKRMNIGHGGAILLDNRTDYINLKKMAYDGRDLSISPWQNQTHWRIGYHYNMRLEDAARGLDLLRHADTEFPTLESMVRDYPDLSKISVHID